MLYLNVDLKSNRREQLSDRACMSRNKPLEELSSHTLHNIRNGSVCFYQNTEQTLCNDRADSRRLGISKTLLRSHI